MAKTPQVPALPGITPLGYRDPRGPIRTAVAIDDSGTETLVTLNCGHIGHFVSHFHYRIGDQHRCFECEKAMRSNSGGEVR